MAGMYILAAVIILVLNYQYIGAAFALIFKGAFSGLGIAGGVVGVFIQGIRRGAFSNEAGIGSSAIAHSAVKTKYPASEGIVALLEPFIDTVVICTMRSEEHTSELQSRGHLVCRLLLEKKKKI